MTRKKAKAEPQGGISLDELQSGAEKLLALLKDRQPGLSTWNIMLLKRVETLRKLLEAKTERLPSKRVPSQGFRKRVRRYSANGRRIRDTVYWVE